nr:hypothetical protein [Halorubrum sp. SD683]
MHNLQTEVSFDESVFQIRNELLFRWSLTVEQIVPFCSFENCLREVRTVGFVLLSVLRQGFSPVHIQLELG